MTRESLRELKAIFREWCSCLTIEEILSNIELVRTIERLERLFEAAHV